MSAKFANVVPCSSHMCFGTAYTYTCTHLNILYVTLQPTKYAGRSAEVHTRTSLWKKRNFGGVWLNLTTLHCAWGVDYVFLPSEQPRACVSNFVRGDGFLQMEWKHSAATLVKGYLIGQPTGCSSLLIRGGMYYSTSSRVMAPCNHLATVEYTWVWLNCRWRITFGY